MAIIGFGNGNFGFINHDGVKLELIDIFKKYDIKYHNNVRDKLEDDDLTPRRLIRFFRYQIQKFLIKNNMTTYLWNKYAPKHMSDEYKNICFPGAEHLIENEKDAIFLLQVYNELDEKLTLNISDRIKRVFQARGVRFER